MKKKILQFAPFVNMVEYEALRGCFEENWLTEGPRSGRFVDRLRSLMGVEHACLAPNGTLALYLGLRALGIGPGDDVVVPDFTFLGSASAVQMTGARPVFCDIDRLTLQTTAEHVRAALTPATRAIMPVHIYGMCCDMDPILDLARERSLMVIEDAAQAVGVFYRDRHAGTLGHVGCFSFFADKTITTGEGGLVITNDDKLHDRLRYLRNQGRIDRGTFIHPEVGYNFRMTDLQAAIGLAQLEKLEEIRRRKNNILARYHEALDPVDEIRFIQVTAGSTYLPFRVAIYAERAMDLMQHLDAQGVQTRTFFYPLHRQPGFRNLLQSTDDGSLLLDDARYPGAIYAYENGVCLPSYPGLPMEDLDFVNKCIREFYA